MRSRLRSLLAGLAIATLVYSGSSLVIPTPVSAIGAATTTTLTSSLDPSFVGDVVTFTATVSSLGSPVTSGTVTFLEVPNVIGGPVLVDSSGQATFSTSTLDEGSHPITARYDGNASFATSNGIVFQHVDNHTTVSGDTFCNTGAMTIPEFAPTSTVGPARPYPSHIFVSGFTANIADVNLQLKGLTHGFPADLDLLLVGPTGANLIPMSDTGGGLPVLNIDLTLDDQASSFLPGPPLTSGTYKPLNLFAGDIFPLPAPIPSSATQLATFNGTNPNGTWSLFVVDDVGGGFGSMGGGWCLTIDETSVTVNQASGQSDPTNTGPIHFAATFERPVTGFGDVAADVTIGGTAGATTAVVTEIAPNDGTTYDISISGMAGSGTVTAAIPAGAASGGDGHGNAGSTSVDDTVTYDITPPAVEIDQATGQGDPTSATPIHFMAVFSEPVSGFGIGDVTIGGTAGATSAVVSQIAPNDGTTYDVSVSGMTGSGTVTAAIPSGSAFDGAANPNAASSSIDNNVTYAPPPVPDTTAPSVSNVTTIMREGGHIGSVSVTVSWSASDDTTPTDSLVFEIQRRRARAMGWTVWQTVATVTGQTSLYQVPLWRRYQYQVRAMDQAGNWSPYTEAFPITFIRRDERHFTRDGSWTITPIAGAMRGRVARSSTAGGTASLTFTGNGVAVVATTGAGQGTFQACIDPGTASQSCRTIDLSALPAGKKQLPAVFTLPWATHTLQITVIAGTVDLDGAIFNR